MFPNAALLWPAVYYFLSSLVVSTRSLANLHILPNGPTWPNKVIFYALDSEFTNDEKSAIIRAMDHVAEETCVRFKPRTSEPGYVRIYKSFPGKPKLRVCGSELGYAGEKPHVLVLANERCFHFGRLLHEFMHLMGFPHEHSRPDRDLYLKIRYDKMRRDAMKDPLNFSKFPGRYATVGKYDYYSLLHYGLFTGSADGRSMTLVPTQPVKEKLVGQRYGFTAQDIIKLNKFFGCPLRRRGLVKSVLLDGHLTKGKEFREVSDPRLAQGVMKMSSPEADKELGPEFWKTFDPKNLW